MAGYSATQIRKPASDTEFEKNCAVLFKDLLNDPNVRRLGTSGQVQDGVDIVGHRNRDPKQVVGIQCKLKSGRSKLSASEVSEEVAMALGYSPALSEYFIVTTAKDDTRLTQLAQSMMLEQEQAGRRIHIDVWGWDTLSELIDQSAPAKEAFDPGFSPSVAAHTRRLDELRAAVGEAASRQQVEQLGLGLHAAALAEASVLPADFADRELRRELDLALMRRGFVGVDPAAELATLAERALRGDLRLAHQAIRIECCERAARSNATGTTSDLARDFISLGKKLYPEADFSIAEGLLKETDGDAAGAMRQLKEIATPDGRSALFNVVLRQLGPEKALSWVEDEHLRMEDLKSCWDLERRYRANETRRLRWSIDRDRLYTAFPFH